MKESSVSSEYDFLTSSALRNQSLSDLTKCAAEFGINYLSNLDMIEICSVENIFKMQPGEHLVDLKKENH